jgi:hypothetical protein
VIPQTTADFFDDPAVPEPPPPPIDFKGRIDSEISIAPPQPIPLDLTDDTVIDPPPGVIIGGDEGIGGSGAVEPQIVRVRADPSIRCRSLPIRPPTGAKAIRVPWTWRST